MQKFDPIAVFVAGIAIVGIFVLLMSWFAEHDRQMRQAYIRYESCVQREYRMTPIAWYEQHHRYPECDTPGAETL